MSPEKAIAEFVKTLPPGDFSVEWHNDVGPDDDRYSEWWEIAGIRFNEERTAQALLAVLRSVPECRHSHIIKP